MASHIMKVLLAHRDKYYPTLAPASPPAPTIPNAVLVPVGLSCRSGLRPDTNSLDTNSLDEDGGERSVAVEDKKL